MRHVPVVVSSALTGAPIWNGDFDSEAPVSDLIDLIADLLKAPPVAVGLVVGSVALGPNENLGGRFKDDYAQGDGSKVVMTAHIDSVKHQAATSFGRFIEHVATSTVATPTRRPLRESPLVSSSEVSAMLAEITVGLGLQDLASEVAVWLQLLMMDPKVPFHDLGDFSFEAEIDARRYCKAEFDGHKEFTADGLLYFARGAPGQDDRTCYILDVAGKLANIFGEKEAGGIWYAWTNDEAGLSALSASIWRRIQTEYDISPEQHGYCQIDLPSEHVSFALMQPPRLVAPGLTAFFDAWTAHGVPPYDAFVPESLRTDSVAILKAARRSGGRGNVLRVAAEELRGERAFVEEMVKINGQQLEHATIEMKTDQAVATKAIQSNVAAFRFVSEQLRADRDFVLMALYEATEHSDRNSQGMTQFVAKELLEDSDVIQAIVGCPDGSSLQYLPDAVRASRDLVKCAVEDKPENFQWASNDLRSDVKFIKEIIEEQGIWILEFASEEVRGNYDVMMSFVEQPGDINLGRIFGWMSAALRSDRQLALDLIKTHAQGCLCVMNFSAELQADREVMLMALAEFQRSGADCDHNFVTCALHYASDELRADRAFILKAMDVFHNAGECLAFASKDLQADRDVVLRAAKKDPHGVALRYASKDLQIELKDEVGKLMEERAAAKERAAVNLSDSGGGQTQAVEDED